MKWHGRRPVTPNRLTQITGGGKKRGHIGARFRAASAGNPEDGARYFAGGGIGRRVSGNTIHRSTQERRSADLERRTPRQGEVIIRAFHLTEGENRQSPRGNEACPPSTLKHNDEKRRGGKEMVHYPAPYRLCRLRPRAVSVSIHPREDT